MNILTPLQIAAVHHGLILLATRSNERIDELVASGNGNTEIADYWRGQRDDAKYAMEALGLVKRVENLPALATA